MTCPDCTQARATRWHGGYRNHCNDCTARAIARSLAAFNAGRDPKTLDDTISRALPELPYRAALDMVRAWWRNDHPKTEETTT